MKYLISLIWHGELLEYFNNPNEFVVTKFKQCQGNMFQCNLWGKQVVFIKGQRSIDLVCGGPSGNLGCTSKGLLFRLLSFNLSKQNDCLLSIEHESHELRRSIFVSAIHKFCSADPRFLSCKVFDIISNNCNEMAFPKNKTNQITGEELCNNIMHDITIKLFFSELSQEQKDEMLHHIQSWKKMHVTLPPVSDDGSLLFKICHVLFGQPSEESVSWQTGLSAKTLLQDMILQRYNTRISEGGADASNHAAGKDIIGCLLDAVKVKANSESLTIRDMKNIGEAVILSDVWNIVTGLNFKLAPLACWFLAHIEARPALKNQLITEIRNAPSFRGDISVITTPEVFPTLEKVVNEVFNLYGGFSAPCLHREALKDIDFEGYVIRKGTPVIIPLGIGAGLDGLMMGDDKSIFSFGVGMIFNNNNARVFFFAEECELTIYFRKPFLPWGVYIKINYKNVCIYFNGKVQFQH